MSPNPKHSMEVPPPQRRHALPFASARYKLRLRIDERRTELFPQLGDPDADTQVRIDAGEPAAY